jgi:hypothetical protein
LPFVILNHYHESHELEGGYSLFVRFLIIDKWIFLLEVLEKPALAVVIKEELLIGLDVPAGIKGNLDSPFG